MAEFMTVEEGKSHFGSNSKANAGLTLGIIGTALGALNTLGNPFMGGGILGIGRSVGYGNGGYSHLEDSMTRVASNAAGLWGYNELQNRETLDQEYDLVEMGRLRAHELQDLAFARERDIAEKADIYRQTKADNNNLQAQISANREYTTQGLVDVYKENACQIRRVEDRQTVDREIEMQERYGLSEKINKVAFDQMKQSYEDRIESMHQVGALAARVSELEKKEAVTHATLPYQISTATCRKIDGRLTLGWDQIATTTNPPVFCDCNN